MLVKDVIRGLDIKNMQIGVLLVGSSTEIAIPLARHSDKDTLLEKIGFMGEESNHVAIARALEVMRKDMFNDRGVDGNGVRNVAIAVLSGRGDREAAAREADLARAKGIVLYAVGVKVKSDNTNRIDMLEKIANSPPKNFVFSSSEYEDSEIEAADKLLNKFCPIKV